MPVIIRAHVQKRIVMSNMFLSFKTYLRSTLANGKHRAQLPELPHVLQPASLVVRGMRRAAAGSAGEVPECAIFARSLPPLLSVWEFQV